VKAIVEGLYGFSGLGFGRVYAVDDADGGLMLIDTGTAPAAAKIEKQLRDAGRDPADVKRILLTHAHPDHVGGLPALKALTGAQVICSAVERDYVEGRLAPQVADRAQLNWIGRRMWQEPNPLPGTPVDRVLQDGDRLDKVFGGVQVIATPGHTPGHVSFWQPARRILITGDAVGHMPWGLSLPIAAFTPDMDLARRSVSRLSRLDPEVMCMGHGNPIRKDATARLRAFAGKKGLAV
jgi:glyoxylase-like metal-dependent hydrolase (beta-lactamase superfamily II)